MKENKTRRITQYGLLVALALILSYLEAQLPVFFAVPGMKLGLTNIVVLVALYGMLALVWLVIAGNLAYRIYADRVHGLATGLWGLLQ